MQAAASNRTFICSVVFLDIVEYSKKPVAEQIAFKERLNNMLTEALANVPPNDRIILDTGDGAALSFLGDPEDALFASLSLRDALSTSQLLGPQMKMRIGVNLGPVKLIKDINGQPNIIGDGINVAQRVMSFSIPGQILVSRSFYEVVSRMSDEYAQLFHFEGSRTDKHVREHEVYAVQPTPVPLKRPARAKGTTSSGSSPLIMDRLSNSASFITLNLRRKPRLSTAIAVVAILALSGGLRMNRHAAPVAAQATPVAIQAPAATQAAPATKVAAAPPAAPVQAPVAKETPAAQKPAQEAKKAEEPQPAAAAEYVVVRFAISPWGEVFINGTKRGVAPPMREFALKPGSYKIEIRNADFPPHVEVIEVKPGSRIRIRHQFK
ncbi:MAG TPA: adenylate/guanylate cyclase domain-containing protein [Burkholderiales bacterium]|nr:adenylate/guanylate cyclase domain-containing protein [Burkholderiales bacterium]